ncbi:DUF6571 family protein [Streptomyces atroolivaceus]|uniref:DUF6571 family protein n=1 Tax=Streptomyces atroolivaceus TaxID=66869 RepID=UPI002023D608|nr:DUF6571 family protein [Streptomyces atroolivaceus]
MLNYEDIVDAPVGKLKAAADDWSEMAGKLDKLATDAADGMKVKADKAAWEGLNAGVTKAFVGKTAKEFADAAAEAKGVKQILEEGHAAIKKAKDDLISIRDHEAPAAGLHVNTAGKVTARNPVEDLPFEQRRNDPDYPDLVRREKAAIRAWQAKIDLIVDNCNDTDVSFKNSLEANVTDRKDFNAPKYTKMDQEEAIRAAALAAKGRDITHTELQALNELLKDNSKSVEFSTHFYEKLGPEKSLTFFGQVSETTYPYGRVDKERLKDVQALQKNMGLNLATASQDKAFTTEWGPELRKLGTERIPMAKNDYGGPFGYQLLGGIMRYGNYDAKFLNPIAEHVAQLHQKDPDMFAENKVANARSNPYNPSGVNGAGYDPIVSMLEALGNSPDAAKHFFADPPTAYNEDGTVNDSGTADLGKGEDGQPVKNYLDFFGTEKWETFGDVNSSKEKEIEASGSYMSDALGHALEAATLGYPAGNPDASVVRDADNAAIMRSVMEKYGEDAGLLNEQSAMADSLGAMGAGYVGDIIWSLDKNGDDSVFAPGKNPEGHLDFSDLHGRNDAGRDIARQFLSVMGQHPDAYATLSTAQEVYTTSVLEAQVGPDGKPDTGGARAAVFRGAEVQGMLDQSRADQVEANRMKTHEDYEKAVAERAGWVEFAAVTGVAAGAAFLPVTAAVGTAAVLVTLATDTAAGAAEQVIGQVVGDVSDNSVDKSKEKAEELTKEEWRSIYRSGEAMAEAPMGSFLDRYASGEENKSFRQDMLESMVAGYGLGNDRVRQQGSAPETG